MVSVYWCPPDFPNGNTRDRQGRIVTCEHGGRRVTRTEYDGRITALAERGDGRRLCVVESRGVPHRKIPGCDVTADGRSIPNRKAPT